MRLALALGKTLEELSHMTEHEFGLWMQFLSEEPLMPQRMDIQFAALKSTLMNTAAACVGGKNVNVKLADVLITWPPKVDEPEPQEDSVPLGMLFMAELGQDGSTR